MIGAVLRVAAWLAVGVAAAFGLYWVFLSTPESSGLMLAVSAILILAIGLVAALTVNGAILRALDSPVAVSLKKGLRGVHWFIVVAGVVLLIDYAIGRGDSWIEEHSGEISAWFIARLGWADVTWLFRTEEYLSVWLRWLLIPLTGLAILTAILHDGPHVIASSRWLRAAWHWRTLLIATAAFVLLDVLPWRATRWRPSMLPATWIEPATAGLRLLAVGAVMTIGAAVMVLTVVSAFRRTSARSG